MEYEQNKAVFRLVLMVVWIRLFLCLTGTIQAQVSSVPTQTSADTATQERIEELIEQLGGMNVGNRRNAANELARIGSPAIQPLIKVFEHENRSIHRDAANVLVAIGSPAVQYLIGALAYESKDVRRWAVSALGGIGERGDVQAIQAVLQALGDDDESVRATTVNALRSFAAFSHHIVDVNQFTQPLINALKDESWWVRQEAAYALGLIGDEQAVQPLIEVLGRDQSVSEAAAEALGKIGDPRAVKPLINAIKTGKYLNVQTPADALVKMSPRSAFSVLEDMKDLYVRRGIARSLWQREKLSYIIWKYRQNWVEYTALVLLVCLYLSVAVYVRCHSKAGPKIVLIAGIALLVISSLYVPWKGIMDANRTLVKEMSLGWNLINIPPTAELYRPYRVARIDFHHLCFVWATIILLTGGFALLARYRKRIACENEGNEKSKINVKKMMVVRIVILAIILLCVFPPWIGEWVTTNGLGRHKAGSDIWESIGHHCIFTMSKNHGSNVRCHVDVYRFACMVGVVILIGFFIHNRQASGKKAHANPPL